MKYFFLQRRLFSHHIVSGNRGGTMIGAIVALLLVGVLGAGVVSMLSTSSFQGVRANHGERAYYLAESGYRYALSVYRNTDDNKIQAVKDLVDDPPMESASGGKIVIKQVRRLNKDEDTIFRITYDQTIEKGDNLKVDPADGAELGHYNVIFEIGGEYYRYLEYDEKDNELKNIDFLSLDDSKVLFKQDDNATAIESLVLVSRGEFPGPGTPFNVAREVSYWQPLPSPEAAGGGGGVS
ncbi:MAG: type II secretion system protein, partial [Desulfobia sp.]